MVNDNQNMSLGEAASRFLAGLPAEEKEISQPEIYNFIRWFGWERLLSGLTAAEVANYAERLPSSDTDYSRKLELVRAFLLYARKKEWSRANLAIHFKARKGKAKVRSSSGQCSPGAIYLTPQGYAELQAELAALQSRRPGAIDEIRKAAADKDFRENVPLQAAREQRGHLEGRIMELEETLKSAVIVNEKPKATLKVSIGDRVALCDLDADAELRYTLVSPAEVDPSRGKISSASPLGKALIGKSPGEIVEIVVPAGRLRYQINQIER